MNGWYALLASLVTWFIAQVWKSVVGLWNGHKRSEKMSFKAMIGYVTRSGGMPSGHSASMMAMTVYLGCWNGFDSGLFALAVIMTAIVIYDAIHVRYAVGRQCEALNGLLEKEGKKPLPVVEGHTIPQVIVGSVLGLACGILIYILTKSW